MSLDTIPGNQGLILNWTFVAGVCNNVNGVDVKPFVTNFQKVITRSGSSYGLSTVSNLEDDKPSSHSSVDPLLPKITGILSTIEDPMRNIESKWEIKIWQCHVIL